MMDNKVNKSDMFYELLCAVRSIERERIDNVVLYCCCQATGAFVLLLVLYVSKDAV